MEHPQKRWMISEEAAWRGTKSTVVLILAFGLLAGFAYAAHNYLGMVGCISGAAGCFILARNFNRRYWALRQVWSALLLLSITGLTLLILLVRG